MTGKIIKGIAGFYYVYVEETKEAKETATGGTLYECKAKGTFRKQKIKPLVGDIVDIAVLDDEKQAGCVQYRHGPGYFCIRKAGSQFQPA